MRAKREKYLDYVIFNRMVIQIILVDCQLKFMILVCSVI